MEQADIDKEQCAQAYGVPLIVVDALSSIAVTSISAKTDGCLDRTAFGS
jgi:ethanolamine ammonia-lyase small subunit